MDRPTIQRTDFPTVRRGYEPDAVDEHLRRVADELESLRGRGGPHVAGAASRMRWTCADAAAAMGWPEGRRMPSTSSATSRRCASTASGS